MGIICEELDKIVLVHIICIYIVFLAMKLLGKIYVWDGIYLQNISDNIIFVYGNSRQST